MVMPIRISALNRKLLRDLLAMKGQALAIAMVVAAGVAMYVMYLQLRLAAATRAAYYRRQRFADVFASLKRAPIGWPTRSRRSRTSPRSRHASSPT